MKLNDNEVIKAMECCKGGETCPDECPFYSTDFKQSCIDDDGIMEQAYDLLIRQRDENARLRGVIKILEADVKAAKSEAYKEFAERLKLHAYTECGITGHKYQVVQIEEIDSTLEELTEGIDYGTQGTD